MKFDYDIIFEFIPEEDKKSFLIWDNVFLNVNRDNIVAVYRAPFEERVFIPLSEYEVRLKQKVRDTKLEDILK
jgi:hypothetical protein